MKAPKHILIGTETLEIYVNVLGQVAVKQRREDGDNLVLVSPGNIPEFISLVTAAAQEAEGFQPRGLPSCEHSTVKICEHSHGKPVFHAVVHGCITHPSPDGGLEIHLGCTPNHLPQPKGDQIAWTHDVVVKFYESEFREVALDGLQILDHKPPATRN